MIKWWNEKREWCEMTNGDAVKFFLMLPLYLAVGCTGWVKTWLLKKDFMGYPRVEIALATLLWVLVLAACFAITLLNTGCASQLTQWEYIG